MVRKREVKMKWNTKYGEMTPTEYCRVFGETRKRRAKNKREPIQVIIQEGDEALVLSQTRRNVVYRVRPTMCECPDFIKNDMATGLWKCKHIIKCFPH